MLKDLIEHPLKPLIGKDITINIEQITTIKDQDFIQLHIRIPKIEQPDPAALQYINSAFWVILRRGVENVVLRDELGINEDQNNETG